MYKNLNETESKLADLMSLISEEGYSASWMENLEFGIWSAINGGDKKYGRYEISDDDAAKLLALSKECGCWIVLDDINEETPIKLEAWIQKFAASWKETPAKK